jgi:hypothetical protein
MLYKTIVHELLKQRPELYGQLLSKRMLPATLDRYAIQLRDSHLTWKEQLSQARPDSDPSQIASEAQEFALKELQDSLPPESPPNDSEAFPLEAAMAYLRAHTPPA